MPRCQKPNEFGKPQSFQLHHFADASKLGYGTVSYIRMTNEQGNIHVSFMIGKARVAPLKQMTIPRLELAAAVVSVKMDKMLRSELQLPLNDSLFWTDSQAVLKYIANDKARFYTYVANRVSFIRDNTSAQQWRYVTSKNNPADDASSGVSVPMFLENKRWICGPEFLWEPEHSWSMEGYEQESLTQSDPEVKSCTVVCNIVTQDQQNPTDKLLSYFSDWTRLLKAVGWYQKFGDILLIFAAKRKELEANIRTCAHHQKVTSQLHVLRATLSGQHLSTKDIGRAENAVVAFTKNFVKRYGVLFTCLSCRAVHLEMASSLDTDSCIHALRRFVCRRGQVKHIWSDNGSNLVGAYRELKKAFTNLNSGKIQNAMLQRGIDWSFNPPGVSHHGGVWERLIRSVRWILNSLLHQQVVDDEGLQTLFCEVEAILNNRPITTASSDPFDLEALTPNHILLNKSQPVSPDAGGDKCSIWRMCYGGDGHKSMKQLCKRDRSGLRQEQISKLEILL